MLLNIITLFHCWMYSHSFWNSYYYPPKVPTYIKIPSADASKRNIYKHLQTFQRDITLRILTPFLVIYIHKKLAFEYPEIIKFSMENQTNVEYKISFMGFWGKCDKYDTRYISYIRANKNYWLSVDVTKSSLFKKIRTLPRDGLMPSIVVNICFAATTFEIISSKKVRTKGKKTTKKGNSKDVSSNLKIKTNVELVRTSGLAKCLE